MLYFCRDKKVKRNCIDYSGFGIIGWNGFPSYYYDSNHCPHFCQVNDFFLNYTVPWIPEVLGGERKLLPVPPKPSVDLFSSHRKNGFAARCEYLHLIKKNSQRTNKHCEFFLIRSKHSQRAAKQFLQ